MIRHYFAGALLVVTGTLACDNPSKPAGAVLAWSVIHVSLYDNNAVVSVQLFPGRDVNGVPREVLGPVQVGGVEVRLGARPAPEPHVASAETVRPSVLRGQEPLVLVPAEVSGVMPRPRRFEFPTFRSQQSDTVRVDEDGSLRLRFTAAGSGTAAARRWSVRVRGAADAELTYSGLGVIPPAVTIPRALMPMPSDGRWLVSAVQHETHSGDGVEPRPDEYVFTVDYTQWVSIVVRQ